MRREGPRSCFLSFLRGVYALVKSGRLGLMIALAGGCVILLLLSRFPIPGGPPPGHDPVVGMPLDPPQRPRETASAEPQRPRETASAETAEDDAGIPESWKRTRAMWEDNHGLSLIGVTDWWMFCSMGLGVQVQQMLDLAAIHPGAPPSRYVREVYGGIDEKWWFQACITVSPLIAKEPPLPPYD